jgi:hypothetical protein
MVEPLAIVVQAPAAEGSTCFIATPFGLAWEPLIDLIKEAASGVDLTPIVTGHVQGHNDFTVDIELRIRSARIVVVVCSPDGDSGWPRPNVMYELGRAHALGKATVLLTNAPERLPADVSSKYAVAYNDQELQGPGSSGLVRKIERAMRGCLNRMQNPLTDSSFERITVIKTRYLRFLAPDFWHDFRNIITLGSEIRGEMSVLDASLGSLVRQIEVMLDAKRSPGARLTNFKELWRPYARAYDNLIGPGAYHQWQERFQSVTNSFHRLPYDFDEATKKTIHNAEDFFSELQKKLLHDYPAEHEAMAKLVEADLLADRNILSQAYGLIHRLQHHATQCSLSSEQLVKNLFGILP